MLLVPDNESQLNYRASFLRIASRSQHVVAASEDGHVTILNADLTTIRSRRFRRKIRAIAFHPDGEFLAIVRDGGMSLIVLDSTFDVVFETETSTLRKDAPRCIGDGFDECYFSPTGDLWTARHLPNGNIEFQVRETNSWTVSHVVEIEDVFGSGSVTLSVHPSNEIFVAWVAAGQDGQQVYWLFSDDSKLHAVEASALQNTIPPTFHPAGHEFLVVNNDEDLVRMSFPDCKTLGVCKWPFKENEDEPGFDYSCCYLSDTIALVTANEGRLFLIDLARMKVGEELHLQSHEPQPSEELYPMLAGDTQLISDMNFFLNVGSQYVISVHQQLPDLDVDSWKDTVVRFGSDLFGTFSMAPSSEFLDSLILSSR